MLSRYCWMKVECSIDIIDNQHDDAGGVDADVTDENGWTLLRTSSWSGQDQCVKTLLEAGAKVCCMIAQIYAEISAFSDLIAAKEDSLTYEVRCI